VCFSLFTFTVFNSCFKFHMNMNILSTVSLASVMAVPTSLQATHEYHPACSAYVALMHNVYSSSSSQVVSYDTSSPSDRRSLSQRTSGTGLPDTLHSSFVGPPSTTIVRDRFCVNSGRRAPSRTASDNPHHNHVISHNCYNRFLSLILEQERVVFGLTV